MSYQKWLDALTRGILTLVALTFATPAGATILLGGGPPLTDCLAVFQTPATLAPRMRNIRCTDGNQSTDDDQNCDADNTVNGECKFEITVCANSTASAACTVQGVQSIVISHSDDNGDPKFDPDFQALQSRIQSKIDPPSSTPDDCSDPTNITVKLKGPLANNHCQQSIKTIKMTTASTFQNNRIYTDLDTLNLICRPALDSCDPSHLYAGTFDRIQKQVFNTHCAVSGCHDSQSQTGGMLLEVGASWAQTVGFPAQNPVAQSLGWLRITPNDPELSLLYHKITGDLGPGLGGQMPLGRTPLPANLIEIIRLWIVAGAPKDGWVAGTDS
jgi:hypothetical protein